MNRITERCKAFGKEAIYLKDDIYLHDEPEYARVERIAIYEDLGLSPDEAVFLADQSFENEKVVSGLVNKLAKLNHYEKLDCEEKLMVLPYPLGTIVYEVVEMSPHYRWVIGEHKFTLDDVGKFGKTVFRSTNEAVDKILELGGTLEEIVRLELSPLR